MKQKYCCWWSHSSSILDGHKTINSLLNLVLSAERRWRKSGLTVHRQIFTHHREKVKKLFLQAKKNYVCYKIESSSSCKDLFHITDQLSGKKKGSTLPSSIPTVDLPDTFGDFFSNKI